VINNQQDGDHDHY